MSRSEGQEFCSLPGRVPSVDVFRGLVIAGMIVINHPGSRGAVYAPLRHVAWHGWSLADLIFPSFLFLVGVSIPLSLARRAGCAGLRCGAALRVLGRSVILFDLGLLLNVFPTDLRPTDLLAIRIPGVLQRTAMCYLAATWLTLALRPEGLVGAALGLLLVHRLLLRFAPVPGFGAGHLDPEANFASYVDQFLLSDHLYQPGYDPEGVLGTLPAVATTLSGVLAGRWLLAGRGPSVTSAGLFVVGACVAAAGWIWSATFPINKCLWTGSFVLLSSGLALQGLGLVSWVVEVPGARRWSQPFAALGANAMAAYLASEFLMRATNTPLPSLAGGAPGPVRGLLFEVFNRAVHDPMLASLAYGSGILFFLMLTFLVHSNNGGNGPRDGGSALHPGRVQAGWNERTNESKQTIANKKSLTGGAKAR